MLTHPESAELTARLLPKLLFTLFILGVVCLTCGKKGEKGTLHVLEEAAVEMIPQVHWSISMNVPPFSVSPENGFAAAALLEEAFVSNLGRDPLLRVTRHPEWSAGDPDFVVLGTVYPGRSSAGLALMIQDLRADTVFAAGRVEGNSGSFFVLAGEAAGRVRAALQLQAERGPEPAPVPASLMETYLAGREALSRHTREDLDRAAGLFKSILRIDSTFTPALLGLADCYLEIAEFGDAGSIWLNLAMSASVKAASMDADNHEAGLRIGNLYLRWGDYKHAEAAFRRCLMINSSAAEAWSGLAAVFSHYGLYQPCLKIYSTLLALDPDRPETVLSRAMIQIGSGRYTEAENGLRAMLPRHPGSAGLESALALSLYYQGRLDEAGGILSTLLERDPEHVFAHAVTAMIDVKRNLKDNALAELELYVRPHAGSSSIALAAAAVYALLERNGQAIEYLKKAVQLGYREYPWLMNDPNFEAVLKDERAAPLLGRLKSEWEQRMKAYE